ncbi:uncharacterized protein [Henckelia pumila]|uniref:uncharacterized protein n=1 Tax=Henckelia pumila TaxID=405737 RepID=UPI003C6E2B87
MVESVSILLPLCFFDIEPTTIFTMSRTIFGGRHMLFSNDRTLTFIILGRKHTCKKSEGSRTTDASSSTEHTESGNLGQLIDAQLCVLADAWTNYGAMEMLQLF